MKGNVFIDQLTVPCIFSAIVDEFEGETEVTFQNVIQHYEETYLRNFEIGQSSFDGKE